MSDANIERAATWIDRADHVLAFAGSGLSAESGVPTFRGEDGLYNDPDIMRYVQAETLRDTPDEALAWFQKARRHLADFAPNPGHYALARICGDRRCTVSTQNIDGLLEVAFRHEQVPTDVIWHLHGALDRARCRQCDAACDQAPDDYTQATCKVCGGRIRPSIVLFGEPLPDEPFVRAQAAAHVADVVLLLGTSGLVYPAASIPGLARSHGAKLVEINPNRTELSDIAELRINGPTGKVLPAIDRLLAR